MTLRLTLLLSSVALLGACASTPAGQSSTGGSSAEAVDVAAPQGMSRDSSFVKMGPAEAFAALEPSAEPRTRRRIDYDIIDDALDLVVFNAGLSTRKSAPPRSPEVGSRFVKGHESRLRLEGNKIFFSQFDAATTQAMRDYTNSLIDIGNAVDLSGMPRNDQLAYWFNLHNMLVITLIAENYPAQKPREIRIGEDRVKLHDAKVATIKGVDLSLRDIRTNVVYRYWNDPRVIYGFFHGDIAGPNIRRSAWTPDNVSEDLTSNAREFVNALRGVSEGRSVMYVSPMYFEAQAGLFPVWPTDLRDHLKRYADDEVAAILATGKEVAELQYEDRTADFVGGEPSNRLTNFQSTSSAVEFSRSPAFAAMVQDYGKKFELLRRQGKLGSRVIIIDVDTEDTERSDDSDGGQID